MPLTNAEKQKQYRERMRLQNPEKYEIIKRKNAERTKKRKKIKDYDKTGKAEEREKWRNRKKKQNDKGVVKGNNDAIIEENMQNNEETNSGTENLETILRKARLSGRRKMQRQWADESANCEDKIKTYTDLIKVDEEDKMDDSDQDQETEQFEERPIQCTNEVEERSTFQHYSPTSAWMHGQTTPARTKDDASTTSAMLELLTRRLDQTEDQFDFVGKNVAVKLRQMSAKQKLIAEKLINDVLFHGLLEQLTLESNFNVFEHTE